MKEIRENDEEIPCLKPCNNDGICNAGLIIKIKYNI